MDRFCDELLADSPNASARIRELWHEYEAAETKEAKFVKDLDRFELGLQAVEYEQSACKTIGSREFPLDMLCSAQFGSSRVFQFYTDQNCESRGSAVVSVPVSNQMLQLYTAN